MIVSPFSKAFDRGSFCCGVAPLDHYLHKQVSQDLRRDVAACFVLHEEGEKEVLGYYTLSAFSVCFAEIPEDLSRKIPPYPEIPATLLGRLAITGSLRGQGAGEFLLMDALYRSWQNRAIIGSWAVVVDAINETAVSFYRHLDFRSFEGLPNRLFLTMREIKMLFE